MVNLKTLGSVRTELQVIEEELAALLHEEKQSAQPPDGTADDAYLQTLTTRIRMNNGGKYG